MGVGGRVQEMREGGGKKGGVGPVLLGCQLLDPSPIIARFKLLDHLYVGWFGLQVGLIISSSGDEGERREEGRMEELAP